ncbi:MAG: hypothetical protein IIA58_04480 [Candidatus Marinimicrobia bacterium]|nr:hypothetical protein [Candidatus Neomarinimicrobiota bacterium]
MALQLEIRRKLIHLISISIPVGYLFIERDTTLVILAAVFVLSLSIEIGRLFIPRIRSRVHPIFAPIMRVAEERKLSGATYLLAGAWITIYFFEKDIAVIALLLVSISDAAAAIVGTAYGKVHLWQKTLEGSTAFFASTGLIMIAMRNLSVEQMLVGLFVGTLVELLPIPVNDNLTLPIITALVMQSVGS